MPRTVNANGSAAETQIIVPLEEYEWLCKILNEPANPSPRLRALLGQKPVWKVAEDVAEE